MSAIQIPSPRSKRRARIEIIPLIDIMFFLLATFVMVSLSMVKSKGVPVHLPGAASGETQNREEFTSITVTAATAGAGPASAGVPGAESTRLTSIPSSGDTL